MWRVRTGSRLHLGLLHPSTAGQQAWPDHQGQPRLPARHFGGVGLMIDTPGIHLRLEPADQWSAEGPLAGRVMAFVRRVLEHHSQHRTEGLRPARWIVEHAPPEHVGLGVGTQLGMAVATLLARYWDLPATMEELAGWVGRGARSAVGVHGFAQGGLLVEGGKRSGQLLAPLITRVAFPSAWRVVLAIPCDGRGLHGEPERAAFAQLNGDPARTDALCRLVLLGILPTLVEADLDAFGEAIHVFNAQVGEAFAQQQGGLYASPAVAELIGWLRAQGIAGVAQSSWGPGVCAFVGTAERAEQLAQSLGQKLRGDGKVWIARGLNQGAQVEAT